MQTADGQLKLIDPIFIQGKSIVEAIVTGRRRELADFTRRDLEDFLTIPVFSQGDETDKLKSRLAAPFQGKTLDRSPQLNRRDGPVRGVRGAPEPQGSG